MNLELILNIGNYESIDTENAYVNGLALPIWMVQ